MIVYTKLIIVYTEELIIVYTKLRIDNCKHQRRKGELTIVYKFTSGLTKQKTSDLIATEGMTGMRG